MHRTETPISHTVTLIRKLVSTLFQISFIEVVMSNLPQSEYLGAVAAEPLEDHCEARAKASCQKPLSSFSSLVQGNAINSSNLIVFIFICDINLPNHDDLFQAFSPGLPSIKGYIIRFLLIYFCIAGIL